MNRLFENSEINIYGFADEELDLIINYNIKYHMGKELGDKE